MLTSIYNPILDEFKKVPIWIVPRIVQVPQSRLLFLELVQARRDFENLMYLIKEPINASSFDHEMQDIDKTLDHSQFTFWSSKGSENRENVEYLDYKLDGNCMVTSISIKPFLAHYQRNLPVYAPLKVSFQISDSPEFINVVNSKMYSMENVPEHQVFELEPVLIGSYFRIYLHGHANTQDSIIA
jgi:hypothetical protein